MQENICPFLVLIFQFLVRDFYEIVEKICLILSLDFQDFFSLQFLVRKRSL